MDERIEVVYPNGFRTSHKATVAEILLAKGAVERVKDHEKRIKAEIAEKKGPPKRTKKAPEEPDEQVTDG